MSTLTVTNSFVNGAANDGPQVTQNFSDVVSYVNSNCIVKDGTLALTALLSGPALDPTSDNHLARKKYVDDHVGRTTSYIQNQSHTITAFDTYQDIATVTVTNPSKAVVVIAHAGVSQVPGNANGSFFQVRVGISFDNGASYTYSDVASSYIDTGKFDYYTVFHQVSGTPSGNIKVKAQHYQSAALSTMGNTPRTCIHVDMFKSVTV